MAEFPNLSRARAKVEQLMIDTVRVYTQGDGVLNETTGQIDLPAPTTIYEGKAKIRRHRTQPTEHEEGGAPTHLTKATIGLPPDAPEINPGAYVEVLTSVRDETLPGRKYLVMEVPGNTFAIQRTLECEEAKIVQEVRP